MAGTNIPAGKTVLLAVHELVNWFIPTHLRYSRSNGGLARVFVETHLVVGLAGLLIVARLATIAPDVSLTLAILGAFMLILLMLPLGLRLTGDMRLVSLVSFQVMALSALLGIYQFGGFASPFLPWLLVALLSGLFYQPGRTGLVLGLFAADVAMFFGLLLLHRQPVTVPDAELRAMGWISIALAMSHMAYMALYYARIIASRAELELEAERYRTAVAELEEARAAAELVSRERSAFFAKMSHELRTPLNAIIGYSEILLEEYSTDPSANTQRLSDLGRINSTGKHLLSLLSDVLDPDNLENEALALNVTRFSLGELADDAVATVQPLIESNGNRLVVSCPSRQDTLLTDETKLRQMLINLLSNAGKFTRSGTVTLELWIERGRTDDRLHAAVADTGIGIAPEALPRLFETYTQADETIYGRFGGTGMGLALTKKFAALLGGSVGVTSKPGEGSRFTIDIPAELEVTEAEEDEGAPPGSRGIRRPPPPAAA